VTAEELIDQSMPFGQGSTLAGSKMREIVAVNLQNGKVGMDIQTGFSRSDTTRQTDKWIDR